MKYSHKQILVLLLFVFSVTTNCCMDENLELKPYEPNTIENIKKQRSVFVQILEVTKNDFPGYNLSFLKPIFQIIYSKKNNFGDTSTNYLFYEHSILSAVLLNPYIENTKKIDHIHYLRHCSLRKPDPTTRDLQFAQLELYERRYKLKDTIMFWCKMHPNIENITQQQFPHEIVQHIGMLMLDTEKSLL